MHTGGGVIHGDIKPSNVWQMYTKQFHYHPPVLHIAMAQWRRKLLKVRGAT